MEFTGLKACDNLLFKGKKKKKIKKLIKFELKKTKRTCSEPKSDMHQKTRFCINHAVLKGNPS